MAGKPTVTISNAHILIGLNKPEDFVLALVKVEDDAAEMRCISDSRVVAVGVRDYECNLQRSEVAGPNT